MNAKTIKYLIYGGIGLVTVVAGYFAYKAYQKAMLQKQLAEMNAGSPNFGGLLEPPDLNKDTGAKTGIELILGGKATAPTKGDVMPFGGTLGDQFPLQKKSTGASVLNIQKKLGVKPETSFFGDITEAALVKKYGVKTVDQALYNKIMSA